MPPSSMHFCRRAGKERQTFWHSSWSICCTAAVILIFKSAMLLGLSWYTLSLSKPHKKKSGGVKLGERASHSIDRGAQSICQATSRFSRFFTKHGITFSYFDRISPGFFCRIARDTSKPMQLELPTWHINTQRYKGANSDMKLLVCPVCISDH